MGLRERSGFELRAALRSQQEPVPSEAAQFDSLKPSIGEKGPAPYSTSEPLPHGPASQIFAWSL